MDWFLPNGFQKEGALSIKHVSNKPVHLTESTVTATMPRNSAPSASIQNLILYKLNRRSTEGCISCVIPKAGNTGNVSVSLPAATP